MQRDIRDFIFRKMKNEKYLARIVAQQSGVLSGIDQLRTACRRLGVRIRKCEKNGVRIRPSGTVVVLEGTAKGIAQAEEELMGWISKGSGIATAAWKARRAAGRKITVVSGAWKKMPPPIKELVRQAVFDGRLHYRISEEPFLYLDKNYVKILRGVRKALFSVSGRKGLAKVVQLKSKGHRLAEEAVRAAQSGADIIMIDTGRKEDIKKVDHLLRKEGLRKRVKIAFGGEVKLEDLKELKKTPVDIVDIGKAIVDAPLVDMRMDVLKKV